MFKEQGDPIRVFSPEEIARLDSFGEQRGADFLGERILAYKVHGDELFFKGPEGIIPMTPFEREPEISPETPR